MKKIKYLNLLVLTGIISLLFSACIDLVEEPKSFLDPDQFYATASQANAAINGIYDVLDENSLHGVDGIVSLGDAGADNVIIFGGANYFSFKSYNPTSVVIDPSNTLFLDFYELAYRSINCANAVVDRIGASESIDAAFAAQIVAEAKFLRAYMYFNLVRLFGDIVYFENEATSLEGLDASRTPVSQVYTNIIADLKVAEQDLSDIGLDIGRAHKWAAKALLAKVYLTTGQYAEATSKCQEVITSNQFQLIPEYNKLFRPENTSLTQEIMFAIQYGSSKRSLIANFITPGEISAYGPVIAPDDSLFKASVYETGDLRKDWTIYDSIQYNGVWINPLRLCFLKYAEDFLIDGVSESESGKVDWVVLRYADVLLMNSEAIAMRDGNPAGAYAGINAVRARAGLPALDGLSQQEFLDKLLHERRVELILEGHRWFDLKRFGKLLEVMSFYSGFGSNNLVFPLPSSALISNSNLVQNNGY